MIKNLSEFEIDSSDDEINVVKKLNPNKEFSAKNIEAIFKNEKEENMNLIEEQAIRIIGLGTEEMNDFVIGEQDDIDKLIEKHNLRYLDDFLRNAFEGVYYYHFFSTN